MDICLLEWFDKEYGLYSEILLHIPNTNVYLSCINNKSKFELVEFNDIFWSNLNNGSILLVKVGEL